MSKTIDQSLEDLVVIANDIQDALASKEVSIQNLSEAGTAIRTLGTGSVKTVNGLEPDSEGNITIDIGVKSVNGVTADTDGNVVVTIPEVSYPVTSVNGKTGDVTLSAADVSALSTAGGSVSGAISATGVISGSSFKATSDMRLKANREIMEYDLSNLRPYKYLLTTDNQVHVGLLAQEVQEVIPEAVAEMDNGYLALDYNAVVAALVGEINILKRRVEALENK